MTVVKICGIAELDQACWALEAGADMLGFVFAPSRRQLPVGVVSEILLHCRRRFPQQSRKWQAVGVFADQPGDFVQRAADDAGLDYVQLSGQESPEFCRQLSVPFFKTVHLGTPDLCRGDGDASCHAERSQASPVTCKRDLSQELANLRLHYGAARLLLDSGGKGAWGGTGTPFQWETVAGAAADCLVAGGLNPENVVDAIAAMAPWGVDVSSGVEADGKKDRDLIRRFVDRAKGGNDRGNIG